MVNTFKRLSTYASRLATHGFKRRYAACPFTSINAPSALIGLRSSLGLRRETERSSAPSVATRSRSESFPCFLAAGPRVQIPVRFQVAAPNQAASADGELRPRRRRGSGMKQKGRARNSGSPFFIPWKANHPAYLLPRKIPLSVASSLRSLSRPSLKTSLIKASACVGP